ncbi:Hsp20/alpha crystallin family protein [Paenibacillus aurantius]|uniref:Hsp20/alpha crystallin family protein n=1 Tax=Paenibacillus aurantius TaxID=2918900 RepID=A0AA96LB34_9BACL|nr:Hsp20/alpha crystallin family protein [Paenibacillus aurantius]WJH34748.1 Hsp20/alpha crystallin family protein [Paenibacillus sp. CC-CFT747]WNQ09960.1 Hsp20/alpha crystallin family protein [Paenibacillus aurantius]
MEDYLSPALWKKLRGQAGQILGEEFWEDLSHLLPRKEPRLDLYLHEGELVVAAELAGLKSPEHLKVGLGGNFLHLHGETEYPYPVPEEDLLLAERSLGRFSRKIKLPVAVLPQEIKARYENGLLVIRLAIAPDPGDVPVEVDFGQQP